MSEAERPNILFLFTDQQSASMMSCAGNRYVNTPALDSLARRGMRFERAYCANPMCVPSRFSLMTGHLGSEIGLVNNTDKHISSIPDTLKENAMGWLLKQAGYTASYGGKVHLPKSLTPEDLGFEVISEDERDGLADSCVTFLEQDHQRPFLLAASFINPHDICHMAIRDFAETESEIALSNPERIEVKEVDKALELPEGVSREDFFAWHCPPLPPNFEIQQDEPEAITLMQVRSPFKRKARETYSEEQWRLHRWVYARLTERVDQQIGRVLQALDDNGLRDDTLVVFSSDHGDMDASHRMEHKTAFYEEAARIPLIIAGAGVHHENVVDTHLVSNGLDLIPTLCDVAGADPPAGLRGRSLRPLFQNAASTTSWRDVLPVESEMGQMVVAGNYKYMLHHEGENREQLIDLLSDPGEMRNAINDPQHEALVRSLRTMFSATFSGGSTL